jgi:hypothetical protein
MSPPCFLIDGGTTISAICLKKPMISKAVLSDGLTDGIVKGKNSLPININWLQWLLIIEWE